MKPKIVFLDRETADIGDIDFSGLEALGEVEYFGTTSSEQIPERIADANIVLTNKVVIGSREMDAAKNLEII